MFATHFDYARSLSELSQTLTRLSENFQLKYPLLECVYFTDSFGGVATQLDKQDVMLFKKHDFKLQFYFFFCYIYSMYHDSLKNVIDFICTLYANINTVTCAQQGNEVITVS